MFRSAWPVLVVAVLAGCPGSTADPCAGVICAPGRTCVNGLCRPDSGCIMDSDCDSGQRCLNGQCVSDELDFSIPDFPPLPKWDLRPVDAGAFDGPATDAPRLDAVAPDQLVPDLALPDLALPDLPAGQWYQANAKNCPTFCSDLGKTNSTSPEGARCMSGEVRPKSGVDAGITFTYGCWSSCAPATGTVSSSSVGSHCYMPGQKQDGDGSDLTVGCFCL